MISRRAVLGTGIGAIAAAGAVILADLTHRLDDVANAIGVKPKPQPVASDDALIAYVSDKQDLVIAAFEATAAQHPDLAARLKPFATIAQAHVTAVGGSSTVPTAKPVDPDPSAAIKALVQTLSVASTERAKDANRAVSPDLARVLSSMSAGLAQTSRAVGSLV